MRRGKATTNFSPFTMALSTMAWRGNRPACAASVSCSAPQRVTVPYLRGPTALSVEINIPFIVHILETRLQRVLGQEKYGKSLVSYVHDLGLLDEHKLVVHASGSTTRT